MEREILQALQTATITAVETSSIPTMPIKFLGRVFTIPNDHRYIEVVHIPNNRTNEYWNEERTYQGLFRLVLHWPSDDAGVYTPLNFLKSVAAYFTKDKTFRNGLASVKIYDHPMMNMPIETGQETIIPVTLPYRCFAA